MSRYLAGDICRTGTRMIYLINKPLLLLLLPRARGDGRTAAVYYSSTISF